MGFARMLKALVGTDSTRSKLESIGTTNASERETIAEKGGIAFTLSRAGSIVKVKWMLVV